MPLSVLYVPSSLILYRLLAYFWKLLAWSLISASLLSSYPPKYQQSPHKQTWQYSRFSLPYISKLFHVLWINHFHGPKNRIFRFKNKKYPTFSVQVFCSGYFSGYFGRITKRTNSSKGEKIVLLQDCRGIQVYVFLDRTSWNHAREERCSHHIRQEKRAVWKQECI